MHGRLSPIEYRTTPLQMHLTKTKWTNLMPRHLLKGALIVQNILEFRVSAQSSISSDDRHQESFSSLHILHFTAFLDRDAHASTLSP